MTEFFLLLIAILAFGLSLIPAVEHALNTWPALAIALVLAIYAIYSAIEINDSTFYSAILAIVFVYGLSRRFISIRQRRTSS